MRSRIKRRGAAVTAAAIASFGLAAATAPAALTGLPPGGQVNDDVAAGIDPGRDAGASDVVGGSLAAAGVRVPWATFEQRTPGHQQVFVRAFKDGQWRTQGSPASLNIDPGQEAEAPAIDFAGAARTVPWVSWYEPNPNLGTATNIFASRFDATAKTWIPEGQDRAPAHEVPSLNIHTDRDAENPAVVGGAAVAGANPVPWVAWQERDGGGANDATSPNQIFASRAIKSTDCSTNAPGGGTSVSQFCWQQTGIKRITKGAATSAGATDPTLNVDPTRDGIEPDFAFTGPGDTVPWVVWYEQGASQIGLRGNEQVFAAKAVADAGADGGFRYVVVGRGGAGALDTSGAHGFGSCAVSTAAEDGCSQNLVPGHDAEDPRIATGTLTPGNPTVPWTVWSEDTGSGTHAIFVARLVGGDHFELFNGGQPVSNPAIDASRPDITFSGNTPYISWHSRIAGKLKTVVGHFEGPGTATFKVDGGLDPPDADVRSPLSSSNTADPFTADGAAAPSQAIGTPFVLHTTEGSPQRLLAHAYQPTDVVTGDAGSVTLSSARVAGSVNPAGAAVKAFFEYGVTTSYGNRTPDQRLGVATTPVAFSATLGALPEYSAIHYRAVVQSDFGTIAGPDRVFVTGVRLPGPGGGPGNGGGGYHPPHQRKRHWPRIDSKGLKLRADGTVVVKLTCPASHGKRCTGTLRIALRGRTIAHARFTLKGGKTRALVVKLQAKDRARVARVVRGGHGVKVKVTAGTSATMLRLVRA
ncbi:MAG: hypothetical protein JWR63_506 [Conexibacter sp.]|nr:hypothetical protein [Conexibacter sp.]